MDAVEASKDPNMVSKKVDELKFQGEIASKALFKHVDKLGVECQKALDASNNDSHVAAIVAFRLNSFSELLGNAMSKLQATDQGEKSAGTSTTQLKLDEQMVSSVLERIEKLEESNAKLEKTCAENQTTRSQSNSIKELEKEINQLQFRMEKVDVLMEKLQAETSKAEESTTEMEHRLETVTTAVKACNSESDKLKEKIKNLQTLVVDTAGLGAQLKKMKSKQKALKQAMLKVKEKDDTASLVLTKKVDNLEKLRKILNGHRSDSGAGAQLKQMCEDARKQIQVMSTNVQNLDADISNLKRSPVGFTVQLQENRKMQKNYQINKLFRIINNTGDCFRPHQGHFVVPHDGLYGFCVKLEQQSSFRDPKFSGCLMAKKVNEDADGAEEEYHYKISIWNDSPHSALCVLDLHADMCVFVKIISASKEFEMMNSFTFSGWSIGYD